MPGMLMLERIGPKAHPTKIGPDYRILNASRPAPSHLFHFRADKPISDVRNASGRGFTPVRQRPSQPSDDDTASAVVGGGLDLIVDVEHEP
jgi:hypothetical protein